jgi:outer membrane protein TolC
VVPPAPEQPIDLGAALRLAEAINPNIALGRQAIQTALARQLQANALAVPHLRAGFNYHLHNGILQNSFGRLRHVDERSLYFGGGARTLAAETLAYPMVQIFTHIGDAIFEPLAARQVVSEAQSNSVAIANTLLLLVATRYLELVQAEAELNAVRLSEEDMNEVVQRTAAYAKQGVGREGDFQRARGNALLLHVQEQQAEEARAVAAAELARVLHLDPSTRLVTPAGVIGVLQLVDPAYDLKQLVSIAQTARPELAALGAAILRREYQIRQEKTRPLFPTVSVGYSAGSFGGSTNRTDIIPNPANAAGFNIAPRTDFDVLAFWTLQNAGLGNVALTRERTAERNMAQFERVRMLNQVGQEVARAYALVQARRQRMFLAGRRLTTAESGFTKDLTRTREGAGVKYLPIEVLNSMNLLARARRELIRATFEYDIAEFELFVALGQPPTRAVGEGNEIMPGTDACLPPPVH